MRIFKEEDLEYLQLIDCLKKTGIYLADIRRFMEMVLQGDETVEARLALIVQQKQRVLKQMDTLEQTLKTLEFKQWYYETDREAGATEALRHMPLGELPEQFHPVRQTLCGK